MSNNGSEIHALTIEMPSIVLCIHCKNFCEAVHPFEGATIGVGDEIYFEDVRI